MNMVHLSDSEFGFQFAVIILVAQKLPSIHLSKLLIGVESDPSITNLAVKNVPTVFRQNNTIMHWSF